MSDKPWLTDPKYGGMSETAAQRSYEAWERQGRRVLQPQGPALPATDAEIAAMKRNIEAQLSEFETAINAYDAWMADWRARQPKGFRAKRRKAAPQSEAAE